MPARKKPGVKRIGLRCEPWFADMVEEAARKDDRSLSSFVRQALREKMERLGFTVEGPTGEAPAKPRGRPRA